MAPTAPSQAQTVNPLDLLDLDAALGDEERQVRDMVRGWTRDKVLPNIAQWFEEGTLTSDLAGELGQLGLLGMHLDGYKCAGASATAYGVACRELEAGDSGVRSLVSVQGSLAIFPIWRYGTHEQKQQWLPCMARGEAIGCFGLTEPDHGSDPGSMKTRARRDGSDWVLNGTKMWITNGGIAAVAIVWAQTDDAIRGFIVPRDTPGFSTQNIRHKLSLRASVTSELIFDDCRLPADAVLPGVAGLRGPLSCLNEARYGICWGAVGAGLACYNAALQYARTRLQWGRPIAGFQLTQQKLVEMALELQKAQLIACRLAELKGSRAPPCNPGQPRQTQQRSRGARSCPRGKNDPGGNGITTEYPVMRHANNLESVLTYEGTTEVHTLILGEAITGQRALT
jgi:glutaryl-CoA dehydrogenase